MTSTSSPRSVVLAAIIGIVALAVGVLAARSMLSRTAEEQLTLESGTALQPPRPLPPLTFIDHNGAPFDAQRLQGRWSLMFFGFTHCPDVCPATLSLLAQVEKQLTDLPAAQRPQVILFSVDPQRDTPEKLAAYVRYFGSSFIGVTGEPARVAEFTRQMGVPVGVTPLGEGGYTVDHSAAVFLINPDGAMRALFSAPHSMRGIAEDYRRVVRADRHG